MEESILYFNGGMDNNTALVNRQCSAVKNKNRMFKGLIAGEKICMPLRDCLLVIAYYFSSRSDEMAKIAGHKMSK